VTVAMGAEGLRRRIQRTAGELQQWFEDKLSVAEAASLALAMALATMALCIGIAVYCMREAIKGQQ
jgi:limonene-1,2-epoxide hydrolase